MQAAVVDTNVPATALPLCLGMLQGWSSLVKDRHTCDQNKAGACQAFDDVSQAEVHDVQLGGGMHAVRCSLQPEKPLLT